MGVVGSLRWTRARPLVNAVPPVSWLDTRRDSHTIFCATANPVEVVVAETDLGRGVLGVIDSRAPAGVETEQDVIERKQLLRAIGYKL